MAVTLPALIFSPKTRIGNEALIYYNLGKALFVGSIVKTASGSAYVPNSSCAEALVAPVGGFLAVRVARYEGATPLVIEDAGGEGVDITIPVGSPEGHTQECISPAPDLEDITGYTMTGGETGDTVELWILPPTAGDVLICYDRGFQANPGTTYRAIPRKNNPVDHTVEQRPENTISMTELEVSNLVGIRKIRKRDVTIIVRVFPDGVGLPCEITYYTNCRFSLNKEIPAEGNDSIQSTATGVFNKDLCFSAVPT